MKPQIKFNITLEQIQQQPASTKIVLIPINGYSGAGKDTFVNYVTRYCNKKILNISSVDTIKEAAIILGWDGAKTELNRLFLSDLKALADKALNTSIRHLNETIEDVNTDEPVVIFWHCRESKNIAKALFTYENIVKHITVWIDSIAQKHISDELKVMFDYDVEIDNYDHSKLEEQAQCFAEMLNKIEL